MYENEIKNILFSYFEFRSLEMYFNDFFQLMFNINIDEEFIAMQYLFL